MLKWKRQLIKRPFFNFEEIRVVSADDFAGMINEGPECQYVFGVYSRQEVILKLKEYGILTRAVALGYGDFDVELSHEGGKTYSIRIHGQRDGGRHLVGETIIREYSLKVSEADHPLNDDVYTMLVMQWLLLQDPLGSVDPERGLLPGQKYPGLGAGKQIMQMLQRMLDRLDFNGIITRPEFIHNGIMYSKQFRYFDPAAEGRLRKLCRQFAFLSMSELSHMVEGGRIIDDGGAAFFKFYQSEQIYPAHPSLMEYFRSDWYNSRVQQAFDEAFYQMKKG